MLGRHYDPRAFYVRNGCPLVPARAGKKLTAAHHTFAWHGPVRRPNHNRSHAGPALRSARLLRPQRVPSGPGESWQKTYSGPAYRREAQGKLMNIRLANALFLDEWMHERAFDPVTACSWSTSACKARKPDTTSPSTASIARTPIASAPAGGPM